MKDDVKKLLAEHRDEILPDARVKEKVRRDLGLSSVTESRMAYARGGEHALTDGRKVAVALIAVLLVAAIFLCIFLPIWLQRGGAPTPGGDIGVFGDADSFYAYGAASVGAILSSGEGSASSSPHAVTADAAVAAAEVYPVAAADADAAQVEILNKYLSLVESLLGGSGITGESVAPAEGYEFGMRVTRVDLLGGHDSYELYYKKIFLGSETDGDETEENYSITGVLVTDGGTYRVSGTYQTESEEDGRESELSFRAYTGDGADSYIEFKQSQESERDDGDPETEAEYVYIVVTDGVRERTVVKYEGEADETELSMVIERYDADGSISREQLFFEDETEDGARVILVRGTLDGEAVAFRIYVRGDGYDYVFSDGTHIPGDRYDDDDDDDDDWDD